MNISIDYKFKPFDMAPIIDTMNAYNALYEREQQIYDTLALKLGDLSSAVEGTTLAKGVYDNFMSRLQDAAANFTTGRDIDTARELGLLRRMYGTDIRQLEQARERMLENTKMLLQLYMRDPSMIMLNVGNLDTYIKDPTYMPKGFSGDQLSDKLSKLLLSMYKNVSSIRYDKEKLNDYYNTVITETGLDALTALLAIEAIASGQNIPENAALKMAQLIYDSTGVSTWGDKAAEESAKRALINGINMGRGTVNRALQEDKEAVARMHANIELEREAVKRQWALEDAAAAQALASEQARQTALMLLGLFRPEEFRGGVAEPVYAEDAKNLESDFTQYAQYFNEKGQLNSDGLKEYKKTYRVVGPGAHITHEHSKFREYLDKLSTTVYGKPFLSDTQVLNDIQLGDYIRNRSAPLYLAVHGTSLANTDAVKNTQYVIDLTDTTLSDLLTMINDRALTSDGKLPIYTWNVNDNKNYKSTVDYNPELKEINDSKISSVTIVAGPRGNVVRITTADGSKYRVPMHLINKGLNDVASADYAAAVRAAQTLEKYPDNADTVFFIGPKVDGSGTGNLSEEDLRNLSLLQLATVYLTSPRNELNKALNTMKANLLAAIETNKVKANEGEGGLH